MSRSWLGDRVVWALKRSAGSPRATAKAPSIDADIKTFSDVVQAAKLTFQ